MHSTTAPGAADSFTLYASVALWLGIIVLLAWAVRRILFTMFRPRVVNLVLFPGTLIAQVGYTVALLVSGARTGHLSLLNEDETPGERPDLPVLGPILIGLLPMLAVGASIQIVGTSLGASVLQHVSTDRLVLEIPHTLAAFWEQLRGMVTLSEETLTAMFRLDWSNGYSWLFVYLVVSLVVRLAPMPRYVRGHVGAIVLVTSAAALAGTLVPSTSDLVIRARPALSLTCGMLLLILLAGGILRGIVAVLRDIAR